MEKYKFYCQLDYEHIPYPSPSSPNGTVADNGCGVCAASMMIENMLHVPFPPEESGRLAKQCGDREGFGTNMYIYSGPLAGRFNLDARNTEDIDEALRFLREGRGMVIANVKGDREGYTGVFADSGHYILLPEVCGGLVAVLDPMYRPGRYDTPGRAGKVRMDGNLAWTTPEVIRDDCFGRSYFLFSPNAGD